MKLSTNSMEQVNVPTPNYGGATYGGGNYGTQPYLPPRTIDFSAPPIKIAILFSGRGSNMRTLAQAIINKEIPNTELALTLCNRPEAEGINYANTLDAPCIVIDHTEYETRTEFELEMQKHLESHKIDIICAAGFMRLLTPEFVKQWHNRIINIHPSLLPAHKGLDTHKAVLDAGDKQHGCTVHYMRPEMDDGPIIYQKSLLVADDDTETSLAARVLELEHIAYKTALIEVVKDYQKPNGLLQRLSRLILRP